MRSLGEEHAPRRQEADRLEHAVAVRALSARADLTIPPGHKPADHARNQSFHYSLPLARSGASRRNQPTAITMEVPALREPGQSLSPTPLWG